MNIKKILLEAIIGFILWTFFLTPYMMFVVKTTWEQYILWLGMQALIVPIIAPIVFRVTKYVEKNVIGK